MLANVGSGAEQVVDARPAARFTGEERDPRPGLAPGHIPNSRSLPHGELFNADGTSKRGDALKVAFDAAGADLDQPLVTCCGSGMTATVVTSGAHRPGKEDAAVYTWEDHTSDMQSSMRNPNATFSL